MGKNNKGNIYLVILIITTLFALLFAGYFFYQNQILQKVSPQSSKNEVVNTPKAVTVWKSYTNSKHGFSLSYPDSWEVKETESKNGAEFIPRVARKDDLSNDSVSLYVGQKSGGFADVALEAYAKVAATKEIQNYNELASFKKIVTKSNVVGYETTWMVQSIVNPATTSPSESLPITYFEIPGDKFNLLRISLSNAQDKELYEEMLSSVAFSKTVTPISNNNEEEVLKSAIKKYIVARGNSSGDTLTISVSKIEGNYAKGMANDDGGGGLWFAAKEDGVWKLVWDGNGIIECSSFTLYPDFPTSMVPQCWDSKLQVMVNR